MCTKTTESNDEKPEMNRLGEGDTHTERERATEHRQENRVKRGKKKGISSSRSGGTEQNFVFSVLFFEIQMNRAFAAV